MAAATVMHVDAATLFVGDDDPTNSQHLVLKGVKLPTLSEKTRDFAPGGGPVALKLGMRKLEAPEVSFKLEGINPTVMNKFMPPVRTMYTMRANIRDIVKQRDIAMKAIIQARMQEVDMGEFGGSDGVETDYKLTEVMYYQVFFDGVEKYYLSIPEGYAGVRIDGLQVFGQIAANLGLV